MNISITRIASATALSAGLLLGAFALSAFATGSWSAPTAPPPGNNVDAPINVGQSSQYKLQGILGIGNLVVTNLTMLAGTGPGTKNMVLTAMDDAGTVGWSLPAAATLYERVNYKNYNPAISAPWETADQTAVDPWPFSVKWGPFVGATDSGPMECKTVNAYEYCLDRNTSYKSMQCGANAPGTTLSNINLSNHTWATGTNGTRKITKVSCVTTYSGDIDSTIH